MKIFKNFLISLLGLVLVSGNTGTFKKPSIAVFSIRNNMEEMLRYHVEHKEFNELLAKRSLRIYIEQFDNNKNYLLFDEIDAYLNPSHELLTQMVEQYKQGYFTVFQELNNIIKNAIKRERAYRVLIQKELIKTGEEFTNHKAHSDYPRSKDELQARIKSHLQKIIAFERKQNPNRKFDGAYIQKVFALWEKRLSRLENAYLDVDAQGKKLTKNVLEEQMSMHVLKAMAKSLDAHTCYFSPKEAIEMRTCLEKQFEGIGVVLTESVEGVVISDLVKGGPAYRTGKIMPGDVLISIDGKSTSQLSYEQVLDSLQNGSKRKIELELKRIQDKQETSYFVALQKEKIIMEQDRLKYAFEPFGDGIIGKLTLPSFYESKDSSSCEADIRSALRELKKQGKLHGLVLDLRDNSGGFLTQAVKVAGLFISNGVIVVSKYAQEEIQYLRELDGRNYYDGPLVILTSKLSASAAEIVAQALQDYGVALVIGDERTYGKGTIQFQTVTREKAPSFFKVTVGRYYTVSGASTQIEGVKANIVVPTRYFIYDVGERFLQYPLKCDRIPSVYADPLVDINPQQINWFQKHYLPNLQKKVSIWNQMESLLTINSSQRLSRDKNFSLFLDIKKQEKEGKQNALTANRNWGIEDLQMSEALNILKDMALLESSAQNFNKR
ncbi:Tail-specific protease [Candidatus Rhabdochlamydia oedothoracis]|uniref:Tail-specific protease n=1 Tax=Candidatus Rhabdochlamydia oedothoracis TaxID=2720720 RepID=A0ABX8V2H6_9BACT|nr:MULTISPECIES: S41 family peptidase [Rhabdochlamydia]KAG6559120.1 Tail-specific protease [Candidatus Rhabdochlamydia sp. W815]QYF49413.1 Tail-specific protease [Candidatus Rhabdochlamydia oedothoracis]